MNKILACNWQASELVQYIYGHTGAIIVAHATHAYCGRS